MPSLLQAARAALRNLFPGQIAQRAAELNRSFTKRSAAAVLLHLYYEDLLEGIFDRYLDELCDIADLFVSVRFGGEPESLDRIRARFPNSFFVVAENRGRDIRPFLITLREIDRLGYRYACKVHTKKSPQRTDGGAWREALMSPLLGSEARVESILRRFESDPQLALLGPPHSLCDLSERDVHVDNVKWLDRLLTRLGERGQIGTYRFHFPAGSMYWFRVETLRPLLGESIVSLRDFELEAGQVDGTLAHAVERVVGRLASRGKWKMEELPDVPPTDPSDATGRPKDRGSRRSDRECAG